MPATLPSPGDWFPTVFDDSNPLTRSATPVHIRSAAQGLRGCINYGLLLGERIFCSDSWLSRNPALCELWIDDQTSLLAREGVLVLARRRGSTLGEVHAALTKRQGSLRHPDRERHQEYVERASAWYERDGSVWEYDLPALALPFDRAVRDWYEAETACRPDPLLEEAWELALEQAELDPVNGPDGRPLVNEQGLRCLAARHLFVFDPNAFPEVHARFVALRELIEGSVRSSYREALPRLSKGALAPLAFAGDLAVSRLGTRAWQAAAPMEGGGPNVPEILARPGEVVRVLAQFTCAEILKVREKLSDDHRAATESLRNDSSQLNEVLGAYIPKIGEELVRLRAIDTAAWKSTTKWRRRAVGAGKVAVGGLAGVAASAMTGLALPMAVVGGALFAGALTWGALEDEIKEGLLRGVRAEEQRAEQVRIAHERSVREGLRILIAGDLDDFTRDP